MGFLVSLSDILEDTEKTNIHTHKHELITFKFREDMSRVF